MTRRYPWAPLATAMGLSPSRAAKVLHAGGRYLTDGMSEPVADRMAAKAGLATYEVWPEMVDHAIEDAGKACQVCGEMFMPARSFQVNCSKRCQRTHAQRRYRAKPEAAARNRADRAAYYAENAEYERARQRRYYAANLGAERARARRNRAAEVTT